MNASHASILIVDDEPLNCDIFRASLQKAGYLTHSVGSGTKALEVLKIEHFDAVLLDINMPGLSGTEVLQHIKGDKKTREISVIMVTAEHDNDTVLECIKLGAADYIKKPVEPSLLRTRLWRCLQKHRHISPENSQSPDKEPKASATILIVDDDENYRALVQHRLSADNHVLIQAKNGKEAIDLLANRSVDLILLDRLMPELDGFQTLAKIKDCERNRHIPVLMCSADDSPKSIEECLKAGANDYILKPFNAALLNARVQSCLLVDDTGNIKSSSQPTVPDIIKDLAERLKQDKIKFPVMPDIAFKLDKLFKENDDISIEDIAEIIKTDPAVTMELIRISNNTYYRGTTQSNTLEEAIMRIGMRETRNHALLLTTRNLFNSDDQAFKKLMDKLWQHSLATAEGSRLIGKKLQHPDLNHLFTLGMLHDMGKFLLLQILFELNKNGRDMDETNIMEIVDAQHMVFGASLMRKWNMPNEFCYTTEQHHTIAEGGKYSQSFMIVCLANLITRIPGYSLKEHVGDDLTQSYPAKVLAIDNDAINEVITGMETYINNVGHLT